MKMQNEWEKEFDDILINAIDTVMNVLYIESKIDGRLNENYFNLGIETIEKKACNYIDGKARAMGYISLKIE